MLETAPDRFPRAAMIFYDISVPIRNAMPVYEGDPPVEVSLSMSIDKGDAANVSRLLMGAHTGTHVDAPRHFFSDGKSVDQIPLDALIGPALVVEMGDPGEISGDHLVRAGLEGEERVLFKTTNSKLWREDAFKKDFVGLTGDAARYIAKIGIKLVGIDYLSVEKFEAPEPVAHLTLLGAGIVVVEGLDLSDVKPGRYRLICLPLRIRGADGSPCRAVLVEE